MIAASIRNRDDRTLLDLRCCLNGGSSNERSRGSVVTVAWLATSNATQRPFLHSSASPSRAITTSAKDYNVGSAGCRELAVASASSTGLVRYARGHIRSSTTTAALGGAAPTAGMLRLARNVSIPPRLAHVLADDDLETLIKHYQMSTGPQRGALLKPKSEVGMGHFLVSSCVPYCPFPATYSMIGPAVPV
jgi:hypothetical protein